MNLMPPQTVVARTGEHVDSMLGVKQYAEHVGAGERTVRTWLADGRLPGARKLNGTWMIPADERPVEAQPGGIVPAAPWQDIVQHMPQPDAAPTPLGELDAAPVFLPLEQAARILGVSVTAIRNNRSTFGVVPFGARGSLVVPQAIVRQLAGIR
jgi:hypothetical protein